RVQEGAMRRGLLAFAVAAAVLGFGFPAAAQQCGPMDVTFVIDNTGSMSLVIANVQTEVGKIADSVEAASSGDYQFGLIALPANDVDVLLAMTGNNRAALDAAAQIMSTSGSCGLAASWDEGLNTAINDTDPSGFECERTPGVQDVFVHQLAAAAAKAGIHVTTIYVPDGGGTDPI